MLFRGELTFMCSFWTLMFRIPFILLLLPSNTTFLHCGNNVSSMWSTQLCWSLRTDLLTEAFYCSILWICVILLFLVVCGCREVGLCVRRLFWCHLEDLLILNIFLRALYCGTIRWSRGIGSCTRSQIWNYVGWRLLMSCNGWSEVFKFILSRPSLLYRKMNVRFDPPIFQILLLHLCVFIFCVCSFG